MDWRMSMRAVPDFQQHLPNDAPWLPNPNSWLVPFRKSRWIWCISEDVFVPSRTDSSTNSSLALPNWPKMVRPPTETKEGNLIGFLALLPYHTAQLALKAGMCSGTNMFFQKQNPGPMVHIHSHFDQSYEKLSVQAVSPSRSCWYLWHYMNNGVRFPTRWVIDS